MSAGKPLRILIHHAPAAVARNLLTDETGYKRSSRDTYLSRLAAKELTVETQRGMVAASATLFEGATA